MTFRRLRLAAVGGLLLFAVTVGCASAPSPTPPVPTPSAPAPTRVVSTTPPPVDAKYDFQACSDPDKYVMSAAAPAYAGPGPHPIAVANTDDTVGSRRPGISIPVVFSPRDAWEPTVKGPEGSPRPDTSRVQLLVCVKAVDLPTAPFGGTDIEGPKMTCRFDDYPSKEFTIVGSSYSVIVREARSGRQVGTFTVPADTARQPDCPSLVNTRVRLRFREIDARAFEAALRPYVENPAH